MSCYWILTISIIAIYTGNLIAFMAVQKHQVPINSLEELAARPEYQAGIAAGGSPYQLFKVSLKISGVHLKQD